MTRRKKSSRRTPQGRTRMSRRNRQIRRRNIFRIIRLVVFLLLIILGVTAFIHYHSGVGDNFRIPVGSDVEAHSETIEKYAVQYGIPEYGDLIKAVMMQESKGRGTDPMQASEGTYNTRYPRKAGSIKDAEYSIDCGIHQLADVLNKAGATGPHDTEGISLALQGYNYGDGYITWALDNYGGYTEENAREFSELMKNKLGTSGYGDSEYVQHVFRFYY